MGAVKQAKNTGKLKPPWPKGVSGNPKGRPKLGLSLAELLRQKGEAGANERIANGVLKRAEAGDPTAAKLYWDRAYGQAPQTVDLNANVHTQTVEVVMAKTRDFFLKHAPELVAKYLEYMK